MGDASDDSRDGADRDDVAGPAEDGESAASSEGGKSAESSEIGESTESTEDGDHPNPDSHPYGEDWPAVRERVWKRDGYACTRCGTDDRTIQAHHVVPRAAGGPDDPTNLLTLCRPCHGVMHPRNDAFDDVREDAPLFPDRDAPKPVRRMRRPDDRVCDRCGHEGTPERLLAWTDPPRASDGYRHDHLVLCRPCAGLLVDQGVCGHAALTANRQIGCYELTSRVQEATVRPTVFAPEVVSVRRPPRSYRERYVDDTPLRFVANSRAVAWLVVLVVGYVTVMVLVG